MKRESVSNATKTRQMEQYGVLSVGRSGKNISIDTGKKTPSTAVSKGRNIKTAASVSNVAHRYKKKTKVIPVA